MIIGLQGYNIASLYLIANMTTTCTTTPLILGLTPAFDRRLDSKAVFIGSGVGLLLVVLYGIWDTGSILFGFKKYFFDSYDAFAFLLGVLGSSLGALLTCQFSAQSTDYTITECDTSSSSSFTEKENQMIHSNDTL
jgi:hypothetical protein